MPTYNVSYRYGEVSVIIKAATSEDAIVKFLESGSSDVEYEVNTDLFHPNMIEVTKE